MCNTTELQLPGVTTVPCDAKCNESEAYDAMTQTCHKCAPGSVPSDSVRVFSSWPRVLPAQMRTWCRSSAHNAECEPWTSHGSFIDSGDNDFSTGVESVLEYTFALQEAGALTVEYSMAAVLGNTVGRFLVDGVVHATAQSDNEWHTFVASLASGAHTAHFVFSKVDAVPMLGAHFSIKSIKVTGLAPVALKCTKCEPGYVQPEAGKNECAPCPAVCYPNTLQETKQQIQA